ncbi:MerR family DNA-binding transcriptional regulator, partial [Faecalibaculum rodentium]
MRTGEFAKAAGVSEKTVRYYDKIGLLKPTRTGKNGYRAYSEDDLIRL